MNKRFTRTGFAVLVWTAGLEALAAPLPSDPAAPDVLSLSQASSLLRVPARIVKRMAVAGSIPARRVGTEWRFNRVALMEWLQGDRYAYPAVPLKAAIASGSPPTEAVSPARAPTTEAALGSGLSIAELSRIRATGRDDPLRVAQIGTGPSAPALPEPQQPIGEQQTGLTAEEAALREQGLAVLKKGEKTMELGLAYSRAVRENFFSRQEVLSTTATLTARYGLAEDLQVTLRQPFVYRRIRTRLDGPALLDALGAGQDNGGILADALADQPSHVSDSYAGDLALNLIGVAVRENVGRPTLLWTLDAVLPTGPGDAGLGAGIVISKSYDPVVLFAGANYLHGSRIDHTDPRRTLAKHNVGFNFGYAYAINDSIALSGQFAGIYRTTRSDSAIPAERENYLVQLGVTWQLGRGLFIDPNIAFGVGSSASDMTFATNVVYTF